MRCDGCFLSDRRKVRRQEYREALKRNFRSSFSKLCKLEKHSRIMFLINITVLLILVRCYIYIYESWYSKKIRKSKYLYAFLIFSHYWKATISHLKEKEMNLDFIVLCCSIIVKGWFFLNAPENLSFLTCYDIIYQFFMKF